jgi:hypothetical protein
LNEDEDVHSFEEYSEAESRVDDIVSKQKVRKETLIVSKRNLTSP